MSNNHSNCNQTQDEGLNDNLQFMRSVVEKADRQIRPEGYVLTACGLICLTCYTAVHFLLKFEQQQWLLPMFLILMAILLGYTFFALTHGAKRQKREGYVPHIPRQVTAIWLIVASHIIAWSILGMVLNNYCGGDPGFIAAMGLSIALSATGILYSREYLYGGLCIFACMFLTYFVRDYGYIVLGIATATGCIVPELICRWKSNKQVQGNG
jgi:FtsH-binding integral membrane protein